MRPLTALLNIGPKSAMWLESVGIHTQGDLAEVGAVEAYLRVSETHPNVSLNLLWSLQGALMDIHWAQLPQTVKDDLLQQLQAT
jgi:DNA transformation protein